MNVLMVGQTGVYNRGCEAIIRSTILMLKERYSDLSVTLATFDYENDSKHDFGFPVKVIPHNDYSLWQRWTPSWWKLKMGKLFGIDKTWDLVFKALDKDIAFADVVISIGGDNYTEDYGADSLNMFLSLNRYIKTRGKKVLIWGASVGPFTEVGKQLGVLENLRAIDGIFVRENETLYGLQSMGLTNLTRVSDPAFNLPVEEVELPDFIAHRKVTNVGFNVSPLLKRYTKDKNAPDVFQEETIKFLTKLLTNDGVNVILLPHVVDHKKGETDDLYYLESIYKVLPFKERIFLPRENYNSEQLKFIISKCDFYLGARTHSTIAALSMKVPTVSIGYSAKARGINEDIFGHNNYVIKSSEYSADGLNEMFNLLKRDQVQIIERLDKILPEIKQKSRKNVEVLSEIVK